MIGVCETPELLEAAVQNLGNEFGGCGRIKNNFAVKDASYMFHLTTVLLNVLVEFDCTFAQLAARPGVASEMTNVPISTAAANAPAKRFLIVSSSGQPTAWSVASTDACVARRNHAVGRPRPRLLL